ncbi:hypothetical protein BMW26_03255 [Microbacterium sp. 1.5R]|uniref:AAA family ATPase n=1 Tax=Microbacterium sp. 1.5R TaxID=1916917 RepID=UPI00090A0BA5|nr:AAA family ATPase [Microbacterium sp. 1.5R]APH44088.1 hypothetical protein BMW26_03255 [Microbacterium sp. 1.5R]
MRVKTLYVRFYRSFNYDYLRKSDPGAAPDSWDTIGPDQLFYPFVRIPLEKGITTVVGANEAGKTQLLGAIKRLLTGEDIVPKDFCRYSDFFAVDKKMALPEFGGELDTLDASDVALVRKTLGLDGETAVSSFWLFRMDGRVMVYARRPDGSMAEKSITRSQLEKFQIPTFFEIDAHVPLPDSVPIDFLADGKVPGLAPRIKLLQWAEGMIHGSSLFKKGQEPLTDQARALLEQHPHLQRLPEADARLIREQYALAEKLLIDVGGIDRSAFKSLREAIHDSEGYANAIMDKLNAKLDAALNFPRWWSQDRDFKLALTRGDRDILFTIRDRTGSDYAFSERSGGMSYFLSYFVQYMSHRAASDSEVLLMDEPDAYLSMLGQQDLLKIFDDFADPQDPERAPVQVVFVTHSPFLIDKNHGERIRVLEKGDGDEGTRVVSNAARNHYEPLRSSLGAFVAETTFIGNCNLMVEGQGDQVLLAGLSSLSRRLGRQQIGLNLNTLSLVPCGGAPHVPYLVYLARGRDVDVPAVVVLLDNDEEGRKAAGQLRDGFGGRQLVDPRFVLLLGELDAARLDVDVTQVAEIEDLIPSRVALRAARHFAGEVLTGEEAVAFGAKIAEFAPTAGQKLFKAADAASIAASPNPDRPLELNKVGFARGVLWALENAESDVEVADRDRTLANFDVLFSRVDQLQRDAVRQNDRDRLSKVINRLRRNFLRDHPHGATGRDVLDLFETIEYELPAAAPEAQDLRDSLKRLAVEYSIGAEPMSEVRDYDRLKREIEGVAYQALREVQEPAVAI